MAQRKNALANGSQKFAFFRLVQIPFNHPAIAACGKKMPLVASRREGVNRGAMASAFGYFLNVKHGDWGCQIFDLWFLISDFGFQILFNPKTEIKNPKSKSEGHIFRFGKKPQGIPATFAPYPTVFYAAKRCAQI